MARSWYRINAAGGAAEIDLYDEIGFWGVHAADFVRDLRDLGDVSTITLNINSPGGSIVEGLAIYNQLLRHPAKIEARVDGLAASMASVIAMAADTIVMGEPSYMMIHDPWGLAIGTADDMRAMADLLDVDADSIAGIYAKRRDLKVDDVSGLMEAETWMTAADAVAKGFADKVAGSVSENRARFNLKSFKNVPPAAAALVARQESAPPPVKEPTMPTNDRGGDGSADVQKMVADAVEASRLAEATRQSEIGQLCALADRKDLALGFITGGTSVADAREALLEAKAKGEGPPVDGTHNGSTAAPSSAGGRRVKTGALIGDNNINGTTIYAKREKQRQAYELATMGMREVG